MRYARSPSRVSWARPISAEISTKSTPGISPTPVSMSSTWPAWMSISTRRRSSRAARSTGSSSACFWRTPRRRRSTCSAPRGARSTSSKRSSRTWACRSSMRFRRNAGIFNGTSTSVSRSSASGSSSPRCRRHLEHDPEKWVPVFGKDHAPGLQVVASSRQLTRVRSPFLNFFEIHALGFDGVDPGDESAQEARADQDQQQYVGADVLEQDRKEKGGHNRADLGKGSGDPGPRGADRNREHLARDQIGHGVGPDVGHETEQHEAGKQQHAGQLSADMKRQRRQCQSGSAADEAHDLQPDAADAVGEHDRQHDTDDQQNSDEGGAFGGEDIALNELGDVAWVRDRGAEQGGEDGGSEDADAVGAEVLQEPRNRSQNGPSEVHAREQRGPGCRLSGVPRADTRRVALQDDLFRIRRIAQQEPLGQIGRAHV